jgi:hypothetical protein
MPEPPALLSSLAQLAEAPYNPRTITPEALAGLKTSMVQFGDLSGITWNARTGRLVCGHQRLKSLRALHGDKLNFVRAEVLTDDTIQQFIATPDGQSYPVRVVDWDDATEQMANVAANNPHIAGQFDQDKLQGMLDEMKTGSLASTFDELRMGMLELPTFEPMEDVAGEDLKPNDTNSFRVEVASFDDLGAVCDAVKALLDEHPEWRAEIKR